MITLPKLCRSVASRDRVLSLFFGLFAFADELLNLREQAVKNFRSLGLVGEALLKLFPLGVVVAH